MGTRTTKNNFLETLAEEVPKYFSELHFTQIGPGTFLRRFGALDHGFFVVASPASRPTSIRVEVGADVPALHEQLDFVEFGGKHYPTLLFSRPLGLLRKDPSQRTTLYHFATVEELREKFPLIYADFVEQAEPWLVLTRKCQEKIRVGNSITITVIRIKGKAVRLGIEAPIKVPVIRGELTFCHRAAAEGLTFDADDVKPNVRHCHMAITSRRANGDPPYVIEHATTSKAEPRVELLLRR